jgi:hypothetical protein
LHDKGFTYHFIFFSYYRINYFSIKNNRSSTYKGVLIESEDEAGEEEDNPEEAGGRNLS